MKKVFKKILSCIAVAAIVTSSLPLTVFAGGGTPNGSLADDSSANSAISTQASTAFDNAKSALNGFNYTGITTQEGNWYNLSNSKMTMPSETYANLLFAGDSNEDYGSFTNSSKSTKGYLRYQKVVFLYDKVTTPRAPIMVVYGATSNKNRYIGAITLSDDQNNALKLIGNWKCSRQNYKYGNNWDYPNVWAMNGSDDIQPGIDVNNPTGEQIAASGVGGTKSGQPGMANKMEYRGSFADDTYTQAITLTVDFYQGGNKGQLGDVHDTIVGTQKCYAVNYKAVLDRIESAKSLLNSISADKYATASINAYADAVIALTSFNPTSLSFSAGSLESDVNSAGTTIKNLVDAYDQAKNGLVERKYTYTFKDSASHTKSCENDSDFATVDEGHTLDSNGYCTVCNHEVFDLTAYNEAYNEAVLIIGAGNTYTSDSFEQYKTLFTKAVEIKNNAKTQNEIDEATAQFLVAKSLLRKKECTITVKKVIGDEESNVTTITKAYGDAYDVDIVALTNNAVKGVEKWTITTDDGKTVTKLNTLDTSVTLYVTKDVTITAYADDEANDDTSSKVVFLGINGRVVQIEYLANGSEPFDTSKVSAPTVPFYTFTKWDTDSVTADGSGKTIYVKAVYSCTNKDDMCTVHFNGETKDYSYDSYVRPGLDPTKQYALAKDAEGKNILTYLNNVYFYAPKTKDIYVVEVSSREAKIAITGSFSQRITEDSKNKRTATFNCKFYLPDDCTLVEWGAEISANGRTQVVKGESISSGNEYSITMKTTSSSLKSFTGVAYVTYKDANNQPVTIKSDSVEQVLVD